MEKSEAASLGSSQHDAVASLKNCACADQASHALNTRRRAPTIIRTAARANISSDKFCDNKGHD